MENGVRPSLDLTVETITSATSKWIGAGSGSDACNDFIAVSGAYPMADEPGTTLSNGPAT